MANRASASPRLGVVGSPPHWRAYHGVAQGGPSQLGPAQPTATTQFPQATALGATWDPDARRRVAAQDGPRGALPLPEPQVRDRSGLIVGPPQRRPRPAIHAGARTEEVYGEARVSMSASSATACGARPSRRRPALLEDRRPAQALLANSNEDGRNSSSSILRRAASGASTTRGPSSGPFATAARGP